MDFRGEPDIRRYAWFAVSDCAGCDMNSLAGQRQQNRQGSRRSVVAGILDARLAGR